MNKNERDAVPESNVVCDSAEAQTKVSCLQLLLRNCTGKKGSGGHGVIGVVERNVSRNSMGAAWCLRQYPRAAGSVAKLPDPVGASGKLLQPCRPHVIRVYQESRKYGPVVKDIHKVLFAAPKWLRHPDDC